MKTRTFESVPRWAGTQGDLARLARESERLINESSVSTAATSLTVRLPRGKEIQDLTVDQFEEEVGTSDIPQIRGVSISSSTVGDDAIEIAINFSRAEGVERMVVAGRDRTAVEGITARLLEEVREGRRPPAFNGPVVGSVLAVVVPVLSTAGLVASGVTNWLFDFGAAAFFGSLLSFVLLSSAIASAPVAYLARPFELLAVGEATRWERWRRTVGRGFMGFLGAVGVAVITLAVRALS